MGGLNFEIYGQGFPTLVFLPGMVGSTRYWYQIKDQLKDKFQVVLVDLLGFGRSPKLKSLTYSLTEHLDYLDKTLSQIKPTTPFTFISHSMGGILALNYAKIYPKKIKSLILISPPIFKDQSEAKENVIKYSAFPKAFLYGASARLICALLCNFLRPLTKYYMRYKFNNLPKQVADDSLLHNFHSYSKTLESLIEKQNIFKIIKDIKCPVLIIYGTKDPRAIKRNYLHLASLNAKVKLLKIDKGTHDLTYTHQEEILKRINNSRIK